MALIDKEQFLKNMQEALEIEDRNLQMNDRFRQYPEWESIAFLAVIAMIDEEYDLIIRGNQFKNLETLQDIYDVIEQS